MFKKIKKVIQRKKRTRAERDLPFPAAGGDLVPEASVEEETIPKKKTKKRRCECCKKVSNDSV